MKQLTVLSLVLRRKVELFLKKNEYCGLSTKQVTRLLDWHLDDAEKVHKVTIVPRGQAGGYAVMLPKEDRYFMTKPELLDKITGLLGGRVAEEIVFGEV